MVVVYHVQVVAESSLDLRREVWKAFQDDLEIARIQGRHVAYFGCTDGCCAFDTENERHLPCVQAVRWAVALGRLDTYFSKVVSTADRLDV